jgi:hypothetical protein
MGKAKLIAVALLTAVVIAGCTNGSFLDKYQLVSEKDGSMTFLDKRAGKVYYVNKSGNIVDVVDLRISDKSVQTIKTAKEAQDNAQKNRDMGEQSISGTKFKLTFQTRYYKDRLLYHVEMKPFDETAVFKASTIRLDLVDTMGFTLEKIEPSLWFTVVDAKGTKVSVAASGELPLTLDNFLEISDWSPSWRF